MIFTVIEQSTGKVLRTGSCHDGDEELQGADGEIVIAGSLPPADSYYDNGGWASIPDQPSPAHTFNYETKQWEDIRSGVMQAHYVRAERTRQLTACDWTQLPDVPESTRTMWASYRQALRDIPLQAGFPDNVTWPNSPQ